MNKIQDKILEREKAKLKWHQAKQEQLIKEMMINDSNIKHQKEIIRQIEQDYDLNR